MTIKNTLRQKRIKEFVDNDHAAMGDYYDLLDSDLAYSEIESEMKKLIEKDKYFFDPYVVLYDILSEDKRREEAARFLSEGYRRAVMKIADKNGDWPEEMAWGFMKNRHLMRVIEKYGLYCWEENDTDQALDIFRRLLRANPGDNQGARHYILAISMEMKADRWAKPFEARQDGQVIGLDAGKLGDWFNENALKFPDEFEWFLKDWGKNK